MKSHDKKQPRDITLLLSRMCDGLATPDELGELAQAASINERVRQIYLEYLTSHAGTEEILRDQRFVANGEVASRVDFSAVFATASEAVDSAAEATGQIRDASVGTDSSLLTRIGRRWSLLEKAIDWHRHPVRFLTTVATLTVVFWFAWIAVVAPWGAEEHAAKSNGTGRATSTFAAQLVRSVDAAWETDSGAVIDGAHLQQGQLLKLTTGLAEVRFESGARVILEAPVVFQVETRDSGRLEFGNLMAHVPQAAQGFFVQTPLGVIEDLGTKFALQVREDGLCRAQVFEGRVRATMADVDGYEQSEVFSKNDSFALDPAAGIRHDLDVSVDRVVQELPRPLAPSPRTVLLSVDFDDAGSLSATQSGFHSFGEVEKPSKEFSGVTVRVTGDQSSVVGGFHDRGAIVSAGGFRLGDVYRDFVFHNFGGTLSFDISGLVPNREYEISWYAYDSDGSVGTVANRIIPRPSTDTLGSSINVNYVSGTPLTSDDQMAFVGTWTSSDGSLEIDVTDLPGDTECVRINGFTISVVGDEPSATTGHAGTP